VEILFGCYIVIPTQEESVQTSTGSSCVGMTKVFLMTSVP